MLTHMTRTPLEYCPIVTFLFTGLRTRETSATKSPSHAEKRTDFSRFSSDDGSANHICERV